MSEGRLATLWGASARVGLAGAFVAMLGLARDVLIASRWGAGRQADAYALVFGFVAAVSVVLSAAVLLVGVPRLAALRASEPARYGPVAVLRSCRGLFGVAAATSLVILVVSWARPGWVYGRAPSDAERATAASLARIVVWMPLGAAVATLLASAVRFEGRHGLASTMMGLRSAGAIVALLVAVSAGIAGVGAGVMAGLALEILLLAAWLTAVPRRGCSAAATPATRREGPLWAALVVPMLPAAMFFTDKVVVSQGGVGQPGLLEFTYKVFALPHTLLAMSVVTVAHVEISKRAHAGESEASRAITGRAMALLAVGMTAVAIVVFTVAPGIVRGVFGHGAMTNDDLTQMAICLRGYAVGLAPMGVGALAARLCFLRGGGTRVALLAAAMMVTNLGLDLWVYRWRGLPGIPVVTSLVWWAWAASLLTMPGFAARPRALLAAVGFRRAADRRRAL